MMGKDFIKPKRRHVEDSQAQITPHTRLYIEIRHNQWPIVYRKEYNVHFLGVEKLHPFDANKWGNIFQYLKDELHLSEDKVLQPNEASQEDLLVVHTARYLQSLKFSFNVAAVAEIPLLALVPNFFVQSHYLRPMRYQVGGSILAGKLALERGWAINIGGGFHHCCGQKGGGFCPYADITLLIRFLFRHGRARTAMIVDLDAHQGNGHERDFFGDSSVYILDIYNKGIYPNDGEAKKAIRRAVQLEHFTEDAEYLDLVEHNLEEALREFHPDIIVYNAGTDILDGDRLGLLSVSSQGIIRRDELVFMKANERHIPVVMLTSGGYLKRTARIIAESIINLYDKGLISGPTV
ncbi:histone deacetylase 11 [Schistocerca americana]|uniref:histone deacetylase 11 n=1 Tax=Schistocerca americana TaxID=7009 RepID=UPI001F503C2B|nr:histone deacetylase 11 [Schistocerca americana]XP_047121307.1 histone deacetylase 11 [Schistocerca piceifrons]XP_049836063.1 histone deacetylase 11 [Schistocerca gregaria]XP_049938373.1 histone deacetylase 11 [Schistocerca serialis cubense]